MCVNERQDIGSGTVKMQGEEVVKVDDFKFLGSTVQSNGECGREVKKRVRGDGGGRVEDVAIFIRSDKNGQDQELHQRDSTCVGGKVWRENSRGKTEIFCMDTYGGKMMGILG